MPIESMKRKEEKKCFSFYSLKKRSNEYRVNKISSSCFIFASFWSVFQCICHFHQSSVQFKYWRPLLIFNFFFFLKFSPPFVFLLHLHTELFVFFAYVCMCSLCSRNNCRRKLQNISILRVIIIREKCFNNTCLPKGLLSQVLS